MGKIDKMKAKEKKEKKRSPVLLKTLEKDISTPTTYYNEFEGE